MGKRKVLTEKFLKQELVLPSEGQCLGWVKEMVGEDKVIVSCTDGYTRLCRIKGGLRRRVWIKPGDVVLVEPWDFQYEKRGDVVWRYPEAHVEELKRRGYLPSEESEELA